MGDGEVVNAMGQWIVDVIKWRNGQVGWVLGGFGGSDGSVWVMGEWFSG